jgi:uncharacterized protein YbjT (DUF2867 family)
MTQTAVVFGATGLVGKELVFELLESQNYLKIIAVVRKKLTISHSRLEQVLIGDFSELTQINDKLNADVYYCCIGTTIKKAGSQEAFRKVDFDIPLTIAKLAQELSILHLVVISSLGANASASNFYLRTKGEMEKVVMETFKGNLKFVRPSLLMGNRDEFRLGEKIAVWSFKVLNVFMFGPLKKYKGIYAWDVARAMIKATELPKEKTIVESDELQDLAMKSGIKHNPHELVA